MGWTSCRRRRGALAIVLLEPGMGLEEVLREVAEAIGLHDRAFLAGQFADFLRVVYKFTRLLLDPGAGRLHGLLGVRFAKLPQEDRWLGPMHIWLRKNLWSSFSSILAALCKATGKTGFVSLEVAGQDRVVLHAGKHCEQLASSMDVRRDAVPIFPYRRLKVVMREQLREEVGPCRDRKPIYLLFPLVYWTCL